MTANSVSPARRRAIKVLIVSAVHLFVLLLGGYALYDYGARVLFGRASAGLSGWDIASAATTAVLLVIVFPKLDRRLAGVVNQQR